MAFLTHILLSETILKTNFPRPGESALQVTREQRGLCGALRNCTLPSPGLVQGSRNTVLGFLFEPSAHACRTGSHYLPPGTAEIQGHRPGVMGLQEAGAQRGMGQATGKHNPHPRLVQWSRNYVLGTSVPTRGPVCAEQVLCHLPPGTTKIQGHRQVYWRDENQSLTTKACIITYTKMTRGKQRNFPNGNQDILATLEPSSPITANRGMPNNP